MIIRFKDVANMISSSRGRLRRVTAVSFIHSRSKPLGDGGQGRGGGEDYAILKGEEEEAEEGYSGEAIDRRR